MLNVNVKTRYTSNGVKNAMYTITTAKLRVAERSAEGRGGRRSAFTLIEVLVVVAIIALLLAILLPSLSRAREISKSTICTTHLKEFGLATSMYTMDHKETLPGPLHPAMFTKVFGPPDLPEFGRQQHLPRMLRKYFSDKSSKTSLAKSVVDDLGTCPSFPVSDDTFREILPGAPYPFHYALNNWNYTAPKVYYFGFINLSVDRYGPETVASSWLAYIKPRGGDAVMGPKKLGDIKRPQSEWAIADAFRRPWADEAAARGINDLTLFKYNGHGSWMRDRASERTNMNSGEPLPISPFHLGSGYRQEGGSFVYNGRVNTLYFDMHCESQRGFRGTVNPSEAALAPP